jgi:tetratricopeptide (TPR) repeat protein
MRLPATPCRKSLLPETTIRRFPRYPARSPAYAFGARPSTAYAARAMSIFDRAVGRAARFIDDVLLLPDEMRERLDRADAALDAGRPAEAEPIFRGVLEARPGVLRALIGWARALEGTGDLAGARLALAEARQQDPDDPRLALLAARLALASHDPGAAVTAAREAARRLAPVGGTAFAEACELRARAEWMRGRPDRAARELRKAIAARPDDLETRIALVEALVDADELPAARRASKGVDPAGLDDHRATRLGLALHRAGDPAGAAPLLERAAQLGSTKALEALARQALARDEPERAEQHARMAVARGGGAAALSTLADVLSAQGRDGEAAHALLAGSATRPGGDRELLVRAARVVPLGDPIELVRVADALEVVSPADPAARALRAHALLGRGELEACRALLEASPPSEPREVLAAARLALADRHPQDALAILDRGEASERLRPRHADTDAAQTLRRDALRMLWKRGSGVAGEGDGDEVDLAAAIDGVLAFAEERRLVDAIVRARALRDELDRPLLLAILGEFNAGKSTLVNAFVGADVAPTGILPTTATLNVLRGGAEKRVRVVRKDGTTREGDWEDLKRLLGDAEDEGAIVDHVEIVLPSELLERVWILDTPGSNAPNPEHEALAREAMRRADAALWVFDAGQAGKASEGAILASVRASKRTVIAALNKTDRLKPEQLAQVKAVLAQDMPEIGPDPVALSARAALRAKMASDDAAFEASGFPALVRRLEDDVFSRSRTLKRRACAGRLLELLRDALATEAEAEGVHLERRTALQRAGQRLGSASGGLVTALDHAIDDLEGAQSRAFEEAASEVLSFVRPRTNRFATHGADPEDRAFLAEVIQNRLDHASDSTAAKLGEALGGMLGTALAGSGLEPVLPLRVEAAIAPPLASFGGYQAGLLSGGALRRFFDEVLPTATLSVKPIAEALGQARAHPREGLRPALDAAVTELARSLERELREAGETAERDWERLRARTYEPLRALHEVLEELVG